jgi:hypothetical protein
MRRASTIVAATAAGVLAWHAGADSAERAQPAATAARAAKPAKAALWASVNKCDTKAFPDTVGIRGSMPGLGKRRTIASMRFRVQFKRTSDGAWLDAGPDATSGWKRLGPVNRAVLESGQDFTFEPPKGGKHVLRGIVDFRWSRGGEVVRQRSRVTTGGHPSSAGGDPKGYSAAGCTIR